MQKNRWAAALLALAVVVGGCGGGSKSQGPAGQEQASPASPATGGGTGAKVIRIGLIQDFTKVYTFVSSEYNQGERDYLELINQRGGIGGYRLEATVLDTGNEPQRGLEAYERLKNEGAVAYDFLSTPVSKAVIPRALEDKRIVITPFHGRADATDGNTFPTIFPLMATYWSQAAGIVDYVRQQEGGNLSGKKIAFVHIDSPFGREPVPVLQALAQRLGFQLGLFSYPSPGTEQSATWTQVRQFKPDWILLWGAGVNQPVSVKEAIQSGFPTNRVISVVWLAESDMQIAGADKARGVLRVEGAVPGKEPAVIQAILNEVYAKGKGAGDQAKVGATYYNYGVAAMAILTEGIRLALERFGPPVTAEKVKQGLEMVKGFDAQGLLPKITITPDDHEGGGWVRISQWDGARWVAVSDWIAPHRDVVMNQARKSAEEFRETGK